LHSGYLVIVEGSIGPFGHLKFILDTGTTRTCIDRGLARQLALPLEAESVFRFDNQVRLNSTHLASLTLGPLQAENFIVNVADLSHVGTSHAPIDAMKRDLERSATKQGDGLGWAQQWEKEAYREKCCP